jgi:hypothetical protein
MLHRIKGIFGADHLPVVSAGHSGFPYHQKGHIPPMSWVGATPGSPNFTGKLVTKMLQNTKFKKNHVDGCGSACRD